MAALGAICLPIVVRLLGGSAAYTMYAGSTWFRLEVVAFEGDTGGSRAIPPTSLAGSVTPAARPFLAGADHLRRTYDVTVLRNHLADVARVACAAEPSARSIRITLVARSASADGPERTTSEHVACAR
jgi:hypothetical protein